MALNTPRQTVINDGAKQKRKYTVDELLQLARKQSRSAEVKTTPFLSQYSELVDRDDFDAIAEQGKQVINPTWKDWQQHGAKQRIKTLYNLDTGEAIDLPRPISNVVAFAEQNTPTIDLAVSQNRGNYEQFSLINKHMTDTEKSIYHYLIGSGDTKGADEYLESMYDIFRQREGSRIAEEHNGLGQGELWVQTAAGIDSGVTGLKNLAHLIVGSEGEPVSSMQYASQALKEDDKGLRKITSDLGYNLGNMLPSVLVGAVTGVGALGAVFMGAGAAGNSYAEMKRMGYDDGQARAYGLLIGASEAALQSIIGGITQLSGGADGVFKTIASKFIPKLNNALARIAVKLGGNMLDEGLEEAIQEVLDPIIKRIATGEDFEGIDWENVVYSGLLGALSSGVTEGGGAAIDTIGTLIDANRVKNAYTTSDSIRALAEDVIARSNNSSARSSTRTADRVLGRVEKGKKVSGLDLMSLETQQAGLVRKENIKRISEETAERLTSLGETGDVNTVARAIAKTVAGQELSRSEKAALKKSQHGKSVLAETIKTSTQGAKTSPTSKSTSEVIDASESKFKASEGGKTVKAKTGEEISIKEISAVNDGDVILRLDNGETISADEVEFGSEDTSLFYGYVSEKNLNSAAANILLKAYDGSVPMKTYVAGIDEAYTYGAYAFPVNEMSQSGMSALLSPAQRKTAYDLGYINSRYSEETDRAIYKTDSKDSTSTKKKRKGRVHFDGKVSGKTLNETQKASLKTIQYLAKALGIDVYVFESPTNAEGEHIGKNGWYDPNDNSIHIDLYAGQNGKGTMLFTMAHELTHFIREWSDAKFRVFADFLLEQYGKHGVSVDGLVGEQMAKAERNGRTIDFDTAYEEVIADACEMMLTDPNVVEAIAKLKAKDQTVWEKIKDFITKLVARITKAYEGLDPDSDEAKLVRNMKDAAEKLKQLWTEAVVEASEVSSVVLTTQETASKGVKNSERDYSYEALTSKPDMPITVLDSTIPQNRADIVAQAKKNATSIGKINKDGSVSVYVKDIGVDVILGTSGLIHGLYRGKNIQNNETAIATVKAGEIISNSIQINELTPQKAEADASYVLIGVAQSKNGELYIVRSVVNRFKSELVSMDVLYAINAKKESQLRSMRPGIQPPVTDSTISIADLLDFVNRYFPDILPQSVLDHYGQTRPQTKMGKSVLYSERDTDSTEHKINTSMTMAEAKRMIETAFKISGIYDFYDGEYKTADEWLKAEGVDEVEMYIENDYDLQKKYIDSNEDILNEEYSISDVLNAYLAGTLTGKEKPKPKRLKTSQSTGLTDSRFYSPQKIADAKKTFELARQRAGGKNSAEVTRARAKIILFAHNKGAAELIGVTQAELNKLLRSWSNYSATARQISERINAGVAEENRWTGIENSAYVSKANVTDEDIDRLVASVEGESLGYQRRYIARVMLAADTHIDYSGLKFKFASSQEVNADNRSGGRVNGFYNDGNRLIEVAHNKPHTVAHEMGHFIDAQWGRDLVGSPKSSYLWLTMGVNADIVRERFGEPGVQFLNNFKLFINSLADVNNTNSTYTNDRKEIFARFFARFVEWTDNIATGNKHYSYETTAYGDKFTQAQFVEFARLLQEKAMLDGIAASSKSEVKYSDRDSEGTELTEQQQEYFSDSKVRDSEGRLITVFHGTEKGGFTVFDKHHSGEAYWFADRSTAESYIDTSAMGETHWSGKGTTTLYEVYLNATNPLVIDADGYRAVGIPTDIFPEDNGRKRLHHIDDIALFAKDNGYDGLIVNNVKDYGLYTEESLGAEGDDDLPSGDVYAVFDSNQIKSTSNKTPTKDKDIRYSNRRKQPPQDSTGTELSEQQQEYFADSKVRDAEGRLIPLWHGTKRAGFTVFKKAETGYFFTDNPEVAQVYSKSTDVVDPYSRKSRKSSKQQNYRVYLNITNPLVVEGNGAQWSSIVDDEGVPRTTDSYVLDAIEQGYDGVIFHDIIDGGDIASNVYVALDSNQIKSTENKTPTERKDIRYSIRESMSSKDLVEGEKFADFIESVTRMLDQSKAAKRKLKIGTISNEHSDILESLMKTIISDFSAKGYELWIDGTGAEHIHRRHGKNGKKDQTMATRSVQELVPWVANNPDKGYFIRKDDGSLDLSVRYFNADGTRAPQIRLEKIVDGDVVFVSECVPDSANKRIYITSAYIKKGSTNQLLDMDSNESPQPTSEASSDSGATIGSVPQNSESVKRSDEKSSTRRTTIRSVLADAPMSAAKTDAERTALEQYQSFLKRLEEERTRLSEIEAKITEASESSELSDIRSIERLEQGKKTVDKKISMYEKALKKLQESEALENILFRETQRVGKEALQAYKKKAAAELEERIKRNQESRKKAAESRHRTEMRRRIKKVVKKLDTLLRMETKKKHIPIGLQKMVAQVLYMVNMDTVSAEKRIQAIEAEMAKTTDVKKLTELANRITYIKTIGDNVGKRIAEVRLEYEKILNSNDPLMLQNYDPEILNFMKQVETEVGAVALRDMSSEQLELVNDLFTAVYTRVRDANKAFAENIKQAAADRANAIQTELSNLPDQPEEISALGKAVQSGSWNILKPINAIRRIGSKTFEKLFANIRKGEDVYAADIQEAKDFYQEKAEQYGLYEWDDQTSHRFKSKSGDDFSVNLWEIMSLYAFARRGEAALNHITQGGITFDGNVVRKKGRKSVFVQNPKAYAISETTLDAMFNLLTADQKKFAEEMQNYLSQVMASKGNEVSLKLYGIKLFKALAYFPLRSSDQYQERVRESNKGDKKIVNSGFTNRVVPNASSPIVLTPFLETWTKHVDDMSKYHALVLPLEDFYRTINYGRKPSDTESAGSIYATIQAKHGRGATEYLDQLLKDINGDVRGDSREGTFLRMLSKFKKAKTFLSLSTIIQQPSSIGRAFAVIDPKYFVGKKVSKAQSEKTWEEIKHYAPVAILKEMGSFDVSSGATTQQWLLARDYKGKEWLKAFFTDETHRDEIFTWGAAKADEIAWCAIWEAAKRKVASDNPKMDVKSEEYLNAVSELFTTAITETQVYDSVMSRSGYMRSKGGFMKMATAFMAEPTTTLNMAIEALSQIGTEGSRKEGFKKLGGIVTSLVLNAMLVSLPYAMRDDDEEETFGEKYLSSFAADLVDGIMPFGYIPLVKDIYSIAQGYDVERTDMSLFSDLAESIKNAIRSTNKLINTTDEDELTEYWNDLGMSLFAVAGDISSMLGIPLDNVVREIMSYINTGETLIEEATGERISSGTAYLDTIWSEVKDTLPIVSYLPDRPVTDKLYDAIVDGDTKYIERIRTGYKTESAYSGAVRKALRDNDPRIKEAAQYRYEGKTNDYISTAKSIINEGNFSQDDVVAAINAEVDKLRKHESTTEETEEKGVEYYSANDVNTNLEKGDYAEARSIIKSMVNEKVASGITQSEAISSVKSGITRYWKELYIKAYGDGNSTEAARIRKALYNTGLYGTANEVVKTCNEWWKAYLIEEARKKQ